jgi:hypothetical protein
MISVNVDVPEQDVEALRKTFGRYVAYYRGNLTKAVEKTVVQIIRALSGSTKVSASIRPLIKNPDPRAKTDARRALFGVAKFDNKMKAGRVYLGRGNPREYFSPLRGTGEYGAAVRYIGRNKVLMRVRGGWEVFTRAELEARSLSSLTLQNHPKRKIGRSGLAKASWSWLLGKLGASAAAAHAEIGGTTAVTRIHQDGAFEYFGILSENKLNYIRKALHGRQPLSTLLQRAKDMMRYDMKEITRESRNKSGLSAA